LKEKELIEIQKQEKREEGERERRRKLEEEKKKNKQRELFEEWYKNFEKEKQWQYWDSNWLEFQKYEDCLKRKEKGKSNQGVSSMMKPFPCVQISLEWLNRKKGVIVDGLVDGDAPGLFIDQGFVQMHRIRIKKSEIGDVRRVEMHMFFKGHHEKVTMTVCELEKADVMLGRGWMRYHHPEIDIEKGEIKFTRCPAWCGEERQLVRSPLRKMRKRQLSNEDVLGPKGSTVQQNMPEMEGIVDEIEVEDQMKLESKIVPENNEEDIKREEDELFERWKKTGERDERIRERIEVFKEDWLTGEEGIIERDDEMKSNQDLQRED